MNSHRRSISYKIIPTRRKIWRRVTDTPFNHDSWGCRVGKGTHGVVERLQTFTRQATSNDIRPAFYLQRDLKSFFFSIDKGILLGLVRRSVRCPAALESPYAGRATRLGYRLYVVRERQDIVFDHKLRARALAAVYRPAEEGEGI